MKWVTPFWWTCCGKPRCTWMRRGTSSSQWRTCSCTTESTKQGLRRCEEYERCRCSANQREMLNVERSRRPISEQRGWLEAAASVLLCSFLKTTCQNLGTNMKQTLNANTEQLLKGSFMKHHAARQRSDLKPSGEAESRVHTEET